MCVCFFVNRWLLEKKRKLQYDGDVGGGGGTGPAHVMLSDDRACCTDIFGRRRKQNGDYLLFSPVLIRAYVCVGVCVCVF